ncbi:MAG: hypothetical protein IPG25_19315, partial [Proteobacteria bacterium]|nr:hypothetical protein [Pseudomonadota bacterium]
RGQYPLFCDRTHAALNQKFPPGDVRLNRLIVTRAGTMIGWLLLTCTPLKNHKQFGNMKLGCIADGLCDSADAEVLVRVAVEWLKERDVDLIVSNQCHRPWLRALRSNLFLEGPSNFVLAMSPALATRAPALEDCYFNRGDGDGPINL